MKQIKAYVSFSWIIPYMAAVGVCWMMSVQSLQPNMPFHIALVCAGFALLGMQYWNERRNKQRYKHLKKLLSSVSFEDKDSALELPTWNDPVYGELVETFSEMHDVLRTAFVALEESAESSQAANAAKSDFLANMSHELRTPMNGVLGMLSVLKDTPLDHDQVEIVDRIHVSAINLLNLLNDILDFSKIEANALELESLPYSARSLVDEVITLLDPLAKEKEIYLTSDISAIVPDLVLGDPLRVRQILINLVGNAIKFTPDGGVKIVVYMAYDDEGLPNLQVDVQDTGVGIEEEKLALIFQKFNQAETSMTRKFGGTGLGLSISQHLVQMMHGTVSVASEFGMGSTFTFTLPYVEPMADAVKEYEQQQEQDGDDIVVNADRMPIEQASILLVEDDPVNQEVARRLLQKLGLNRIDIAQDGDEAVGMYDPDLYNIVLMDCQMPNMDGFTATQYIREKEEETGEHIPVIAVTANALVGDREKCIQAGMDDYLSKPIQLDKLSRKLQRYIDLSGAGLQVKAIESADNTCPVDVDHLAMFTDEDMAVEKELIDLFFTTAHECLAGLEGTQRESAWEEWKKFAHRFKGAAANMGAQILADVCLAAEENAQEVDKQEALTYIHAELNTVKEFMLNRHGLKQEEVTW